MIHDPYSVEGTTDVMSPPVIPDSFPFLPRTVPLRECPLTTTHVPMTTSPFVGTESLLTRRKSVFVPDVSLPTDRGLVSNDCVSLVPLSPVF